jgi:hypothetical protein
MILVDPQNACAAGSHPARSCQHCGTNIRRAYASHVTIISLVCERLDLYCYLQNLQHMPPAESFPGRPATADVTSQERKLDSDDLEKQHVSSALEKLDIEHATVQDDPRDWSHHRKVCDIFMQLGYRRLTHYA